MVISQSLHYKHTIIFLVEMSNIRIEKDCTDEIARLLFDENISDTDRDNEIQKIMNSIIIYDKELFKMLIDSIQKHIYDRRYEVIFGD